MLSFPILNIGVHLGDTLRSIIRFDDPCVIARKIVKYAKWRGINVKPEFEKYGE
jgi:hypothetical protein